MLTVTDTITFSTDAILNAKSLPWWPSNAPVEIYNFLIGCPLQMPWCPCPFKNKAYRPALPFAALIFHFIPVYIT